jgi:hypothetical protein
MDATRRLLDLPDATAAQLSRARAAAHAVFEAAGVWPVVAQLAFEARRGWMASGFQGPSPSPSELQAAATFALARQCARAACAEADSAPPGEPVATRARR